MQATRNTRGHFVSLPLILISTSINQVYFWITSRQYSPFPEMSKSLIAQHLLTGHHNTKIHIIIVHALSK